MRGGISGFVLVLLLSGCLGGCASTPGTANTGPGVHFGGSLTLHVCVLKSISLNARRANAYIADLRSDLAAYRISLEIPWIHPWEQPSGGSNAILADLAQRPLEAPCDRLVALADRTGTAFISGLVLPEIAGEADRSTATHGYILLAYTAPNPLFRRAQHTSILEFHALLGCTDSMSETDCEHRIAELKAAADPDDGFFPGISEDGAYLTSRAAANDALLRARASRR